MGQELLSQVTTSAIVIYALQWLKRTQWVSWISQETPRLNRALMLVGSALGAVGIHFAFDAAKSADGTYVLTITGLTLANVLHGLWHWANQAALTQLAYDATLGNKPPAAPTITLSTH